MLKQFQDIQYTHTINKRARSYRLKIDSKKGLVAVTPPRYNQNTLNSLIKKNSTWITTNLNKLNSKKQFLETTNHIRIFNTLYTKKITVNPAMPSNITLGEDQVIHISVPHDDATKVQAILKRFLTQTAQQYIAPKTKQLAAQMGVDYTQITYGEHKSQWGSCHRSGALTFNWRLVHAPVAVIDYVIVHELAHRVHHNHSAAFWALVAKFDPHYESSKRWLKTYGLSVG